MEGGRAQSSIQWGQFQGSEKLLDPEIGLGTFYLAVHIYYFTEKSLNIFEHRIKPGSEMGRSF